MIKYTTKAQNNPCENISKGLYTPIKCPQTCPASGHQVMVTNVPVTVTPLAHAGAVNTYCIGRPSVIPGVNECFHAHNGACSFTLRQEICVNVPVFFGAEATLGDPYVSCTPPCPPHGGGWAQEAEIEDNRSEDCD